MNDIVVIGAGGLASELAFLIDDINREKKTWNILGYVVNEKNEIGKSNGKYKVFNTDEWLMKYEHKISAAFGIGDPKLIKKLSLQYQLNNNIEFPNLFHPNVIGDWERIKLGIGNIICAGNVFTTNITVGSFNYFNLSCTVGHEAMFGDFNVINPTVNISGGVNIRDKVSIGTGAQLLQYLNICSDVIIGAGAVVTKHIVEPGVYTGIPAKRMR